MSILEAIVSRRSIREFKDSVISDEQINQILEAGRWAPSGLNNQPWRFSVIRNKSLIDQVAELSKYSQIIKGASLLIAVFLDNEVGYHRTKDVQSMGACIQNMLLVTHDIGLGACWIGEILNQREKVEKVLGVSVSCELMAILAVGQPLSKKGKGLRLSLDKLMLRCKEGKK